MDKDFLKGNIVCSCYKNCEKKFFFKFFTFMQCYFGLNKGKTTRAGENFFGVKDYLRPVLFLRYLDLM